MIDDFSKWTYGFVLKLDVYVQWLAEMRQGPPLRQATKYSEWSQPLGVGLDSIKFYLINLKMTWFCPRRTVAAQARMNQNYLIQENCHEMGSEIQIIVQYWQHNNVYVHLKIGAWSTKKWPCLGSDKYFRLFVFVKHSLKTDQNSSNSL